MKTFFLNAPHNVEVKNFLRGDFLRLVREKSNVRLVVFVDPAKLESHRKEFAGAKILVEPEPDAKLERRSRTLWRIIVLASIPTGSIKIRQKAAYLNGGSLVAFLLKRFLWVLGHTKIWRSLLRFIEFYFFREDRVWRPYFRKYKPAAVFAPSLMIDEDTVFLKAARRLGVRSVGMVRSWDNLSTKLFLRIQPDLLLVQNPVMQKEAEDWNDYPRIRVGVVGFAQFSHYLDPVWFMSKEETARKLGVDGSKRWITYFTGGLPTVVLRNETYSDHVEMLKRALDRGEFSRAAVLVRAHPTDPLGRGKKIEGVPVLDFGKKFEYSEDLMKLLANLIRWSDVVVNLGSTISLEAAIFDRPVVLVGFNGSDDSKVPLHNRLSYALDHTTHYQYVQKTNGVWRVSNEEEMVAAIKTYLKDPSLHRKERAEMVENLVGPIDGNTARRVLEALIDPKNGN